MLNSWILARNGQWLMDGARGAAVGGFWDARIFHPEPSSLAFSEHLFAPTLLALPIYAATGNAVLAYNLLFLSSFFLSALGMYLFVRDLTGSASAAFLAGLFYGFSPYRVDQLPHLQVLSSQWMPFALLGLRRFVTSGRPLPLAGATLALVAQNLSCGYHALYLSPFAGLYALFELVRRRQILEPRRLLGLATGALCVAALTIPFLLPYAAVRDRGVLVRTRAEVESYSADVRSYLTAPENLRLWGGTLDFVRRPEAALFPGLVPLALALVAVAATRRRGAVSTPETAFFLGAALLAGALSLGPAAGPYALLYDHVPGFASLRVPARFAMTVILFLAILAGMGAAAVSRPRRGALAAVLGLAFFVESAAVPLPVHTVVSDPALRPLVGEEAPAIYRHVARLPERAVLLEMPVHSDPEELRFMVPALQHGRRLVNGYSGLRPPWYSALTPRRLLDLPELAWRTAEDSGATHAVVHEEAYAIPTKGPRVTRWLEERGARVVAREGASALLELRPSGRGRNTNLGRPDSLEVPNPRASDDAGGTPSIGARPAPSPPSP